MPCSEFFLLFSELKQNKILTKLFKLVYKFIYNKKCRIIKRLKISNTELDYLKKFGNSLEFIWESYLIAPMFG